ncbi:Uncharacterized protein GBIM_15486 [Gryllus bimaculatus]|nr:Uncharacterized protein GBIM_15486 [Gryllus bimaculatus]
MAFLRAVVRHNVSRKLRVNLCDINGNCTLVRLSHPTSSVVPIALKSSHAASALGYDTELQRKSESQHPKDPLDTAFADPEASFKSKTTWEVIRAYIVYTLCSSEYLVEHNMKGFVWVGEVCYVTAWPSACSAADFDPLLVLLPLAMVLVLVLLAPPRAGNDRFSRLPPSPPPPPPPPRHL